MFKIALLALSASLAVSAAQAQTTISVTNLGTEAGSARFEADVRRVAVNLCSPYRGVSRIACFNDVREEAVSQLPEQQRLALERSQQENTRYASREVQAG